ncbi:sensor histidine kinase [Piscinibacter sp.]|uniref:sensor histidine kinase n=1 Tax=Piscinibacter sp. TaxID=1903157 RepID=UPI002B66909B|nr:ATP-binding protein [Albitalea sp.]HUG25857.1 ATP-binding protein [Albitalea sp.]
MAVTSSSLSPADVPPRDQEAAAADGSLGSESAFDSGLFDRSFARERSLSRWMGWRMRLLVGAALLGCLGLFFLARWLGDPQHIDAAWRANPQGQLELASTSDPLLRPHVGRALIGIVGGDVSVAVADVLTLQRSSRWMISDADRERHRAMHEQIAASLSQSSVKLFFSDGDMVELQLQRRGFSGLGGMFWLLSALALVLYLVSMVVLLARPNGLNLLYSVMALSQTGNLVFIAVESTLELALPMPFPALDMPLRMGFDLVTAAALVNAVCLHPRRLPGAGWIALGAWAYALALIGLELQDALANTWWWTQASAAGLGWLVVVLLSWSYRVEPHPFAIVLRRFCVVAMSTWVLLTVALAVAGRAPGVQHNIAAIGSMIWYVFLASLLLLVPFLSKSQQIMREFSLLAAISTVATSLDLLFVAVFSFGQFASLTLSLFLSLGVYAGARQWILNQLLGNSMLTTERMFEQLYRIAREVEARPERAPSLLSRLLRELFEPMEVVVVDGRSAATRVVADGSAMILPVPRLGADADAAAEADLAERSIVLRFAHRGRRLFTSEDARLADRIVEQLRRAVAFDKAVEQGRSEERARLAQDLHDDIGARLLTLMYKAHSPEMEEYVRHTLQDLKTLTRGLAASNHRLSHAAAEWKADLTQRLTAAHIELGWNFTFDDDVLLTVVQWSGLTRVLRELVSNIISHAQARRVDIDFNLEGDRLDLSVIDDGIGRNPLAWSHGLGLGGVRKRVKQLGGEVEWRELSPHGIGCRVIIREFSARN